MNLALAKNETGRALSDSFAVARDRLPGTGKVAEARRAAFEPMSGWACRIAGSRTGNTPICAR